jgi:hypothetical protein
VSNLANMGWRSSVRFMSSMTNAALPLPFEGTAGPLSQAGAGMAG